jgi:hypothetical protein
MIARHVVRVVSHRRRVSTRRHKENAGWDGDKRHRHSQQAHRHAAAVEQFPHAVSLPYSSEDGKNSLQNITVPARSLLNQHVSLR